MAVVYGIRMGHAIRLLFIGAFFIGLIVFPAFATSAEATAEWKTAQNLFAAGKCQSALVASEKAIALDPEFAYPWNVKGCALHCLGRNEEAMAAFKKALELDPMFTMAQKNIDHTLQDLKNGAPLSTAPVSIPVDRNESIPYDGELMYNGIGEPTGCSALLKEGHGVLFHNNGSITVTGVRVAGCRYGKTNADIRVELWDTNFTTLATDTLPYAALPFRAIKDEKECMNGSSWVDIPLPDHPVTGDFYLVIFTNSYPMSVREHGIFIVFNTPSETGSSVAMLTGPNQLDTPKIGEVGYATAEVDWLIHVLYTNPPVKQPLESSPEGQGTIPGETGAALQTKPENASASGFNNGMPSPAPTRSGMGYVLVIAGVALGIFCLGRKKQE
jgi:hypothetical protein